MEIDYLKVFSQWAFRHMHTNTVTSLNIVTPQFRPPTLLPFGVSWSSPSDWIFLFFVLFYCRAVNPLRVWPHNHCPLQPLASFYSIIAGWTEGGEGETKTEKPALISLFFLIKTKSDQHFLVQTGLWRKGHSRTPRHTWQVDTNEESKQTSALSMWHPVTMLRFVGIPVPSCAMPRSSCVSTPPWPLGPSVPSRHVTLSSPVSHGAPWNAPCLSPHTSFWFCLIVTVIKSPH